MTPEKQRRLVPEQLAIKSKLREIEQSLRENERQRIKLLELQAEFQRLLR